jgi:hypothetical protein
MLGTGLEVAAFFCLLIAVIIGVKQFGPVAGTAASVQASASASAAASQGPYPTSPTCNGQPMNVTDMCQVTSDTVNGTLDYDQMLAFEQRQWNDAVQAAEQSALNGWQSSVQAHQGAPGLVAAWLIGAVGLGGLAAATDVLGGRRQRTRAAPAGTSAAFARGLALAAAQAVSAVATTLVEERGWTFSRADQVPGLRPGDQSGNPVGRLRGTLDDHQIVVDLYERSTTCYLVRAGISTPVTRIRLTGSEVTFLENEPVGKQLMTPEARAALAREGLSYLSLRNGQIATQVQRPLSAPKVIDTLHALARVVDALPADVLRGASTTPDAGTAPDAGPAPGNRRADWPDSWR